MYDARPLTLPDTDHRRLVRAASRLLGPAEAEDAVQDAYVRALEGEQRELNSAQAWLLTVVRNLAIDRLRRRNWMQQWLETMGAADAEQASPSAEMDAALAQEATRALRLLAAQLAPEDGAALLLHEVFEVGHAEIAEASGRSEAASRQQLRRALLRLRQARSSADDATSSEQASNEDTVLRLYLQALQLRDPQVLWAMLRHPPISAAAGMSALGAEGAPTPHAMASGVVQMGGQLGLVLTLDGVRLCVVPLGVRFECGLEAGQIQ
jgi:RNA polymerase sigma factor (sigma-70 family)